MPKITTALHYQQFGYKAIRLQSGVPGLASTYGVSKDRYHEPADADLPTENVWSSEKYMRSVPPLSEMAREALGWDVHLLHDVRHRLTPIAADWARIEPYRPFRLEDATPAGVQEYMRHTAETDRCSPTPTPSPTACSSRRHPRPRRRYR